LQVSFSPNFGINSKDLKRKLCGHPKPLGDFDVHRGEHSQNQHVLIMQDFESADRFWVIDVLVSGAPTLAEL
jgi:hypothetical protein